MIYIQQYNALFNEPEVKEPDYTKTPFGNFGGSIELYNNWLSSRIEIVREHSFKDRQSYQEDVHYRIDNCCANSCDGFKCKTGSVHKVAYPIQQTKEAGEDERLKQSK